MIVQERKIRFDRTIQLPKGFLKELKIKKGDSIFIGVNDFNIVIVPNRSFLEKWEIETKKQDQKMIDVFKKVLGIKTEI